MSIVNAAGTKLTKAQLLALTTNVVQPVVVKFTEDIWETYQLPGAKSFDDGANLGRRKLFIAGEEVPQSKIDAMYAASVATFGSIAPAGGTTAGGTAFTITGTGFAGVRGVTIGGAAATAVKVVSDTKITGVSPVGTAGAKAVVIQDASGDVTAAGAFTYA